MRSCAAILLLGLSLAGVVAGDAKIVFSDRDFAAFPEGSHDAPEWRIRASGEAGAIVADETPASGANKRSLRLQDPEIEETINPLDASVLLPPLDLGAGKGILVSFDFRMTNVGENSNLLFRVYDESVNTPNYVGAIQFFNNWDGEGDLRAGTASGSESGKLAFDHWYRVTVNLPLPGVEGTQAFTVTDLDNPDIVISFSEKVTVMLSDYRRLSFSSGFGDRRKLDALISNISIQTIP